MTLLVMFALTGWGIAAIFILGAFKVSKQAELQEDFDSEVIDRLTDDLEERDRQLEQKHKQVKFLQSKLTSSHAITPYAMNVKHAKNLVN